MVADAMNLPFDTGSVDIVICTQVYEHVPDPKKLMLEVYRVLKKDGICYFAGGNRIRLMESHYDLPLLSLFPKPIANIYIRLFRNEKEYYETLKTYWGLKKLVNKFKIKDYTGEIFSNPEKFGYKIRFKNLVKYAGKYLIWLSPNYIWILEK
jgi:ubiquinone/menaquinone biosynthesis C-methylase UbiE